MSFIIDGIEVPEDHYCQRPIFHIGKCQCGCGIKWKPSKRSKRAKAIDWRGKKLCRKIKGTAI